MTDKDLDRLKDLNSEWQHNEAKYRNILDQLPSGVVVHAADTSILYANAKALELLELSRDEIMGIKAIDPCWCFVDETGKTIPTEDYPVNRVIRNREPFEGLIVGVKSPNTPDIHWGMCNAFPIFDDKGNLKEVIISFLDITQLKRSEQEILQAKIETQISELRYQSIYSMIRLMTDTMPDMLWAKNLNKEFLYVNKAICDQLLFAEDTEEPIGKTDLFFAERQRRLHPENPNWHTFGQMCQDSDEITLKNMRHTYFEESGFVEGKPLYLEVHKAPLIDDSGHILGVVGSARRINSQKDIERQLKQESQLRQLLVSISTQYINLPAEDIDKKTLQSLAEMAQFVGADRCYIFDYDEKTGICSNTFEWCADGIEPQVNVLQNIPLAPEWVAAFAKREPMYVPNVAEMEAGEAKNTLEPQGIKSLLSLPMYLKEKCIGFIGFDSVKDQHIYSETEMQLLLIYAEMLINVKQRMQNEREMILAKDKALESDRLKSAFLATINHELRTPLNHIMGFGQLIEVCDSVEEAKDYASLICRSGKNLMNMIQDIFDLAMADSNLIQIRKQRIDCFDMFVAFKDTLLEILSAANKDSAITISFSPDMDAYHTLVDIDVGKTNQVLNNLFRNAVKYTWEGNIEFGFKLLSDSIRFFVKDTGIGIPADKQDIIFEFFRQVDDSDTRLHGGVGIGLAISRKVCEVLGADLSLESSPGSGSCFYLNVPATIIRKQGPQTSLLLNTLPDWEGKTILIADDDHISRMHTTKSINLAKAEVITASNGKEAIELIEKYPSIDLVLMDKRMPVMDGLQATVTIKRMRPKLPIIALTANADDPKHGKSEDIIFDAVIQKPYFHEDLFRVISFYLEIIPKQ